MQIIISGSLAYDRIMNFDGKFDEHILPEKIEILNVCFPVKNLVEKFGGTAGNIAYSLSMMGERPLILTSVGRDFGPYMERLQKMNLPIDGIRHISEELTACAYVTTDLMDRQITIFNPGAMGFPSLYNFENIDSDTIAIISPGNADDMLNYSRHYKDHGIRYIFDPGQQIPILTKDILSEIIEGSEILISNIYEIEMIKNALGLKTEDILKKTGAILTTLGEDGVLVQGGDNKTTIKAAPVSKALDPTGAGDAFRAGLLKGIVLNKDIVDCAKMGLISAAYSVETVGTQQHIFSWEDFKDRYKLNFGCHID